MLDSADMLRRPLQVKQELSIRGIHDAGLKLGK
jgi:hypothetical protein